MILLHRDDLYACDHARGARWVVPQLVGEVVFRTWTADGRIGHAAWRGLRPDREPETATDTARIEPQSPCGPVVQGGLCTTDGRWQVEVLACGTARWYRIVHQDSTVDHLTLADVETILAAAGVGLDRLTEAA